MVSVYVDVSYSQRRLLPQYPDVAVSAKTVTVPTGIRPMSKAIARIIETILFEDVFICLNLLKNVFDEK